MYYSDELYHHGVLGMKWGIRRYQNEDGSYTEAGKKRYGKMSKADAQADMEKRAKRIDTATKILASVGIAAAVAGVTYATIKGMSSKTSKVLAEKLVDNTAGKIVDRNGNVLDEDDPKVQAAIEKAIAKSNLSDFNTLEKRAEAINNKYKNETKSTIDKMAEKGQTFDDWDSWFANEEKLLQKQFEENAENTRKVKEQLNKEMADFYAVERAAGRFKTKYDRGKENEKKGLGKKNEPSAIDIVKAYINNANLSDDERAFYLEEMEKKYPGANLTTGKKILDDVNDRVSKIQMTDKERKELWDSVEERYKRLDEEE